MVSVGFEWRSIIKKHASLPVFQRGQSVVQPILLLYTKLIFRHLYCMPLNAFYPSWNKFPTSLVHNKTARGGMPQYIATHLSLGISFQTSTSRLMPWKQKRPSRSKQFVTDSPVLHPALSATHDTFCNCIRWSDYKPTLQVYIRCVLDPPCDCNDIFYTAPGQTMQL